MRKVKLQPLYVQVKKELMARIASGLWKPRQTIPNEVALAGEFDVSQGTVRRALDEMVEEGLIRRKQGVGTTVAEETNSSAHTRFFHFHLNQPGDAQHPQIEYPSSEILEFSQERPNVREREFFATNAVTRIKRLRLLRGAPVIFEHISINNNLLPGIAGANSKDLPDALYSYYHKVFGVRVFSANDQIYAAIPDKEVMRSLGIKDSREPVLELKRVAYNASSEAIEIRRSFCRSTLAHYRVLLV